MDQVFCTIAGVLEALHRLAINVQVKSGQAKQEGNVYEQNNFHETTDYRPDGCRYIGGTGSKSHATKYPRPIAIGNGDFSRYSRFPVDKSDQL